MTAEAPVLQDVPTPKFKIGQKVFHATVESATGKHPCPDCLGSGKWTVTTPAGTEMIAGCQRCGPYSSSDIPSLAYQTWEGVVRGLTIGSIQIDTAAGQSSWREDPVRYMCRETGIGSGSVYDERKLFVSEEEARQVANAMTAAEASKAAATPQRLEKERVSHLRILDLHDDQNRSAIWNSWYRYRNLREQIEEFLKDESVTTESLREDVQHEMDFDARYRHGKQIFESLIEVAAKSDDPTVKAIVDQLPFKPMPARDDAL